MQSHEGTYCARSSPRVDPIYQHIGTWKQAGTCQVSKSISSSPFFHPRPQFSRFKARTWLHNLIGERINNSNNQMNSFDQEASKKGCECFPRSTGHNVKVNVSGCVSLLL